MAFSTNLHERNQSTRLSNLGRFIDEDNVKIDISQDSEAGSSTGGEYND